MKINENTRYPHPVLSDFTGDYKAGIFSMDITVTEDTGKGGLTLNPEVQIDEENIENLITEKKAQVGFFITCPETYFNKLITISLFKDSIEIEPGKLRGRVQLRPIIWLCEDVSSYESNNLHDEYNYNKWAFSSGTILAIDYESVIYVGREKLAPMETIFSIAKSDDVPDCEIRLQMEGHKIKILANTNTYNKIHTLRGNKVGKTVLLNSIYLPAVMGVLSSLKDDYDTYQDKRWFRVFNSKCEHMGINISSCDILSDAQKLLESPFGIIMSTKEFAV